MSLEKAITDARVKQKLTLRELAKKAKLSHQSVFRLEQGAGGIEAAIAVLTALGFKPLERKRLLNLRLDSMVRQVVKGAA